MKKIAQIILLYISLTILFPGFLVGQTPEENAWKYWYYRWRLINDFLLIGDCHGCSIPASIRLTIPYKGHQWCLDWGDSAVRLGWYISALAGEYRILHDNGEPTDIVAKELYYALLALERLDAYSDEIEQGNPNLSTPQSTPYPNSVLDGYFVRDDVPEDFVQNNWDHFNSGWTSTVGQVDSTSSSYGTRIGSASAYPCGSGEGLTGIGESIDQAAGVLHGLAAVKFLTPPTASYNGYNFHNWVNQMVDRIVGHIKSNNAHPYSNCQGGYIYSAIEAQVLYFPFAEAGCRIKQATGQPLQVSHTASYFGFGIVQPVIIKHPPYNEFYFLPPVSVLPIISLGGIYTVGMSLGFPPNSCSDFNAGIYNTFSNMAINSAPAGRIYHKFCNKKNALSKSGIVPSIVSSILPLGNIPYCKLCSWRIGISSTLAPIAQPYYGIKIPIYPFLFIPWPIPNFLRFFWVSVKNRNETEHVLEGLARGADHNIEPLIAQVYYTNQYRTHLWGEGRLQNLMNIAPCKGPYHFDTGKYVTDFGINPNDLFPNNEWMGICRFNRPEMRLKTYDGTPIPQDCHDLFKGEFSGLDYMNLYNYYLFFRSKYNNFSSFFAHYENIIDRELVSTKHDLPIILANNWGSFQYPAWIAAFHTIEASNVLSKKAQVEYVAGEYIHLKPGFHAQQGCYFHAYLDTLRGCDYSKKPANYQGPFFPFANQTSYGKFAPPASEADVPEKITVPEERFEAMHSQSGYLHVFPNPANKILHVKSYGPEGTELIIRDVFGRILFQEKGFFEEKTIDISTWNKGVYIVEMKHLEGTERTKFIKIK